MTFMEHSSRGSGPYYQDVGSTFTLDRQDVSVYQQRWFLQSASDGFPIQESSVVDSGVELGYLPFIVVRGKLGLLWGGLPHWTHTLDPVLKADLSPERREAVLQQLVGQLPSDVRFRFSCLMASSDAGSLRKAMQAHGFRHAVQVTYSFPSDDPGLLTRFNKKHRTHIRAAERSLAICELSASEFIGFYAGNLETRGVASYAPLRLAERIISAGTNLVDRQVRVIGARSRLDPLAPLDAAIACVWDKRRCYLWMCSRRMATAADASKPHPDAVKLLIIDAAEHARAMGRAFDLDGVTNPGQENFYKTVLKAPCVEYRDIYLRQRSYLRALYGFRKRWAA